MNELKLNGGRWLNEQIAAACAAGVRQFTAKCAAAAPETVQPFDQSSGSRITVE